MKHFIVFCLACFLWLEVHGLQPSRFVLDRNDLPSVVYYFSMPELEEKQTYPIFVICGGSDLKGNEQSVLTIWNFFSERISALDVGCLAIEKCGMDGDAINRSLFWSEYTRSNRLRDHLAVISNLQNNPPPGWNGHFIFAGASEGGPLVTELSILCANTIATINWCGAGDLNWADELWDFFEHWKAHSLWIKLYFSIPRWCYFSADLPATRHEYDMLVQEIISNPSSSLTMAGMTYLYHADAFQTPPIDYTKIKAPFLVVTGTEDSFIKSSDLFVEKALHAGAPITYLRVEGMDHYVRKRIDVVDQTFMWVKEKIEQWEQEH